MWPSGSGRRLRPRAIVTWTLAADGVQFYLDHGSRRKYRGKVPIREVDVISKAVVVGKPPSLPPAFHPVERLRWRGLPSLATRREASNGFRSSSCAMPAPVSAVTL